MGRMGFEHRVSRVSAGEQASVRAGDLPMLVAEALPRVLRDVERTTGMVVRVDSDSWGLSVPAEDDLETRVAAVADQIQEWVVENKVSLDGSSTWPECPQHPRTHPMSAQVVDGLAWWVCPRNEQPEARIGDLLPRGKLTGREKRNLRQRRNQ